MSKYNFDFTEQLSNMKAKEEASKSYGDSRFWKYGFDKSTLKGSAVIRFLPDRPAKNALPYIAYFAHWFKFHDGSMNQTYNDNCATSISKNCPICYKNRQLWKSPHPRDEQIARDRKRKAHFISNILVIEDIANPDNEGKIFLWDYGAQLYNYLSRALYGPSKDDEDFDEDKDYSGELWEPHNPITGGDFYVKSTKKKNSDFLTYAPSHFGEKGIPIFPDLDDDERDEKLDELFSQNRNGANKVSNLDNWFDKIEFPIEKVVQQKLISILGGSYDETEEENIEDGDPEMEVIGDTPDVESEVSETKKSDSGKSKKKVTNSKDKRNEDMSDVDYLKDLLDK